MPSDMKKLLDDLSSTQRVTLLLVGALILIFPLTFFLVFGRSTYVTVVSNVPATDMAKIVELVEKEGVEYKLSNDGGSLMVPEDDASRLTMQMSASGLPGYGHVGFEIFSDSDYGRSDFSQKVNYMRAMQGELARTIMTLPEVRDARVHLVLPEKALFASQQEEASASITLIEASPGAVLTEQVSGIQRLVAASIRGMQSENVVVLTDKGVLLSRAGNADDERSILASAAEREREKEIETKVRKVVGGYLKSDDFVISVAVSMEDEKYQLRTEEPVLPGQEPVVKAHKVHTRSDQQNGSERQSGSKKSTREEETSYAVGTRIEERNVDKRVITRVTVAVVLPEDVTAGQTSEVHSLIEFAAGLDQARGDQVFVSTAGIARAGQEVVEAPVLAPTVPVTPVDLSATQWGYIGATALASFLLSALLFLRRPSGRRLTDRERKALASELEDWLSGSRGMTDV